MRLFGAALAAMLLAACSHPLEIRNLDEYAATRSEPLEKPTALGLVASAADTESRELIQGIGAALGKYQAEVVMPYSSSGPPVDAVARVAVTPHYEGAGSNLLVTFPGLLVAAPMWAGYRYAVDYTVNVLLTRAWDNAKIDAWTVPVRLDLRHAETPRLTPGYDPAVTPLLVEEIRQPLGEYLAQDIVRRLNASGQLWKLARPPELPTAAPAPTPTPPAPVAVTPPPPPAAPAPVTRPPPVLAKGGTARLKPGAAARNRPMPQGAAVDVGGAGVKLGGTVRNASGTWWYVTGNGQSGWVAETDLVPAD